MSHHLQIMLWVITFALMIVAAVRTLRHNVWLRPAMGFVAAVR